VGSDSGKRSGGGRAKGKKQHPYVDLAASCEHLQPEQSAELLGILFPGGCVCVCVCVCVCA